MSGIIGAAGAKSGIIGEIGQEVKGCELWYLTSALETQSSYITANYAKLGESMGSLITDIGSGVFSFKKTGYYRIDFNAQSNYSNASDLIFARIYVTQDATNGAGGTYTSVARGDSNRYDGSGNVYSGNSVSYIFDVENISTHAVKFHLSGDASVTYFYNHSGSEMRTCWIFTRLGDT